MSLLESDSIVSIIVPIYNASRYLCRCIDSLVQQTYSNIEVILVDDGSIDGSGRICDQFAEKDGRIHVIHQDNHGVSFSRIVGLNESTGNYVMFVDADDYIDKDAILKLITVIFNNHVDVVVCQLYDVYEDKLIKNIRPVKGTYYSYEFNHLLESNFLFDRDEMRSGITLYLCGKLFKRSVLNDQSMKIGLGVAYGEDMLIFLDLFKHHITSITIIDDILYYYYHHPNQVTAQSISTRWPDYVAVWEKLFYLYDKDGSFSIQLPARIAYYSYKSAKKVFEEGNSRAICIDFLKRMRTENIVQSVLFRNESLFKLFCNHRINLFLFLMKYRLYRAVYLGYRLKNRNMR